MLPCMFSGVCRCVLIYQQFSLVYQKNTLRLFSQNSFMVFSDRGGFFCDKALCPQVEGETNLDSPCCDHWTTQIWPLRRRVGSFVLTCPISPNGLKTRTFEWVWCDSRQVGGFFSFKATKLIMAGTQVVNLDFALHLCLMSTCPSWVLAWSSLPFPVIPLSSVLILSPSHLCVVCVCLCVCARVHMCKQKDACVCVH